MGERTGRIGQIKIYLGKCFRIFMNEMQWRSLIFAALIMVIVSMVTGKEMFGNFEATRTGAFAIVCACIWIGLFNSVQSVCREREIIKREHRTGLHISSYVLAHVLFEVSICAMETLIVTAIVYIKNHAQFPESGLVFPAPVDLGVTLFMIMVSADMIGLLISCIVKTPQTAMTVMPFVLIIQLVMSDTVFPLSGFTEMISYLTLSKWGLNGFCALANTNSAVYIQYKYSGSDGCTASSGNLIMIWMLLVLFSIVYIVIGIFALKRVDRDRR